MLPIGRSDFSWSSHWGGSLGTKQHPVIFVTIPSFLSPLCNVGLSDIPGEAMVKLYCPKCMDVYTPKSSRHHHTDGAYFGTGFPHMLFMVHPEYRPKRPANQFVPRFVPKFFCISVTLSFQTTPNHWPLKSEEFIYFCCFLGCMVSKSTRWLINSSFRQHQLSRAQ